MIERQNFFLEHDEDRTRRDFRSRIQTTDGHGRDPLEYFTTSNAHLPPELRQGRGSGVGHLEDAVAARIGHSLSGTQRRNR